MFFLIFLQIETIKLYYNIISFTKNTFFLLFSKLFPKSLKYFRKNLGLKRFLYRELRKKLFLNEDTDVIVKHFIYSIIKNNKKINENLWLMGSINAMVGALKNIHIIFMVTVYTAYVNEPIFYLTTELFDYLGLFDEIESQSNSEIKNDSTELDKKNENRNIEEEKKKKTAEILFFSLLLGGGIFILKLVCNT